jgi:hypothetical protein
MSKTRLERSINLPPAPSASPLSSSTRSLLLLKKPSTNGMFSFLLLLLFIKSFLVIITCVVRFSKQCQGQNMYEILRSSLKIRIAMLGWIQRRLIITLAYLIDFITPHLSSITKNYMRHHLMFSSASARFSKTSATTTIRAFGD